jgi:hypothetical protein
MDCGVCQTPLRETARFCHCCGFPREDREAAPLVVRDLHGVTAREIVASPGLARSPALSAEDLLAVRDELLRRFSAEMRLLVRLTEHLLDTGPPTPGDFSRLLSLERQVAEEWQHSTLTVERLAAVEHRLGMRSESTELARRRAALMLKLELDGARIEHWLAHADGADAAVDAVVDGLAAALDRQAAELEEIRTRLATGATTF